MPNSFYNASGNPSTGASLASATIRAEFSSIASAFNKFPTLSSSASKILTVNSGGTAVEAAAETGSGAVVRATSPTLVTPNLGVATATSINKITFTQPATGSTVTIADGKTLTASNTLTFAGTDGSTLNIGTGGTLGTGAYVTIANYAPLASPAFTGQATVAPGNAAAPGWSFTGYTGAGTWADGAGIYLSYGGLNYLAIYKTTGDNYASISLASGGYLQVTGANASRLGDGTLVVSDGITAPGTINGYTQIYTDTADGDLKVKFGDGTVATLAPDTGNYGVYTPTISSTTNIDSTTPESAQWIRIGNIVSVTGRVAIDPTGAGDMQLHMTLPVASNLAAGDDLNGVITCFRSGGAGESGYVVGDSAANDALVYIYTGATGSATYLFHFQYEVL